MRNKEDDAWDKLDELCKDGCYTMPQSESEHIYDVGAIIREHKRLGRPLTEKEKEKFKLKN